jgi:hypothetical protein
MEHPFAQPAPAAVVLGIRARIISAIGPAVVAAGLIWAMLQPWRVTLLHPRDQGLWWLVAEPPLLVAGAGILFALVVARPLLSDLEDRDAASR